MRDTLRIILILLICACMAALCAVWFEYGGKWGLIGGAVAFLWGVAGSRPQSLGERLGNGYVGALMGLSVGMAAGAFVILVLPQLWIYLQQWAAR